MGYTKWTLYFIDYKSFLQLQTPYTLLSIVSSEFIWYAGWLSCGVETPRSAAHSLVKGIQMLSTYCESEFFNGARSVMETEKAK